MGKKDLSKEDRLLWQLYTKSIKPAKAGQNLTVQPFKIKTLKAEPKQKFARPSVSNFDSLKNFDSNWGKKLKAGKVKPDGKIDLHGMTCVEAHEKLYRYLERAQKSQKRVILVVTGKGGPRKSGYADIRYSDFENSRGVLRREVPHWLSSGAMRHMIVSFQDARQSDGGTGALYVVLKRNQ